ncbi:MAG: hypothetical protein ABJB74_11275 [Gemmatimonas sp.]
MHISMRLIALATLLMAGGPLPAQLEQPKPVTGLYVLQRMHDTYAGKWYKTLTFTQKTTRYTPDGTPTVQTWYESMRSSADSGTQLRIDIGDLTLGRGMWYTADSSIQVVAGTAGVARANGNEFVPLIQGVYVEPVARTSAQLTRLGFDLTKGYHSVFEGLPVWVVGVSNSADTTGSRFVIDTVRRVVTRVVLVRRGQAAIDVSVGGYVRAGNGWLATRVAMQSRGAPMQTEEYSDWKIDTPLPASLFDVRQWSTAPHWARKP